MIDNVQLSTLKRLIASIEKTSDVEDPVLSFEFIVGSLYPKLFENVMDSIREARTEGYIDGAIDNENISKNISSRGFEVERERIETLLIQLLDVIDDITDSLNDAKAFLAPVDESAQAEFVSLLEPRAKEMMKICQIAKGEKDED